MSKKIKVVSMFQNDKPGEMVECPKCGILNELRDGYIWEKSQHPTGIGCNCSSRDRVNFKKV
jgi:DNA-directed RNA polymerase subunit RPC12/RpoP